MYIVIFLFFFYVSAATVFRRINPSSVHPFVFKFALVVSYVFILDSLLHGIINIYFSFLISGLSSAEERHVSNIIITEQNIM